MKNLLFIPLIENAKKNFHQPINQYHLEENFNSPFWQFLEREMEKMILPALAIEIHKAKINNKLNGRNPKERYKSFFDKPQLLRKKFFSRYPQLKIYLEIFLSSSCNYLEKFFKNISKDKNKLSKEFNLNKNFLINEVSFPQNGDRHHLGRQLLFFTLNQKKFVFNQTPVNTDELINFLIEKIVNQKIPGPPIKIIKTLSLGNRHYRQFLDPLPANSEKEIKSFYQQLGKLVGLVYFLNGIDFHMDNLLAQKDSPYLLDTETILTNFEAIGIKRWKNILNTGFFKIKKSKLGDISGISGGEQQRISLLDPYPINDETDNLAVCFKKPTNFKPHNRLYFQGKIVNPEDYLQEIAWGFNLLYDFFLKNKKDIKKVLVSFIKERKIYSRQIFRPTACYYFLIVNLFQPNILKNKDVRNWVYNYLLEGFGNKSKIARKITEWETKEILNLDIPYFYTRADQTHLYAEGGKIWKNFFKKTPLEYLENKIESLSLEDKQKCKETIKKAIIS